MRVGKRLEVRGKKYFIAMLLIFSAGCCGTSSVEKAETKTKLSKTTVPVPEIVDTLEAKTDIIHVYGEKIVERDTVIRVEYYPKEKKIYLKAKPDSIVITKLDTITIYKTTEIVQAPGFWEKEFWYILILIAAVIVLVIVLKK